MVRALEPPAEPSSAVLFVAAALVFLVSIALKFLARNLTGKTTEVPMRKQAKTSSLILSIINVTGSVAASFAGSALLAQGHEPLSRLAPPGLSQAACP